MTVLEEIRQETRVEDQANFARKLLKRGVKTSHILEDTGITSEQLEEIKATMG